MAQGRVVPAHGLVQDPRAAEQAHASERRREAGRRHLLLGRQPRAGRRSRSRPARDPRRRRHGGERDARQDRGHEAYGAEVVLHGTIWDEANEKARELVEEQGLTYVHPFDDLELIAGQGTLGLEIYDDLPDVHTVVVPIGGGGLISGVSSALKSLDPDIRVIGVESSGAPAMERSVAEGRIVQLDEVDCAIDGLKVKRVGENTFEIVSRMVDEIVTLPDERIFEALLWTLARTKIVVEGAAAAPVAALLNGLVRLRRGARSSRFSAAEHRSRELRGLTWN